MQDSAPETTEQQAEPAGPVAALFGSLDADQRIRAIAEKSERTLWTAAVCVTLIYASAIAFEVHRGGLLLSPSERERIGQDGVPDSINVELVEDPDKDSKSKYAHAGPDRMLDVLANHPPQQPQAPSPEQKADDQQEKAEETPQPVDKPNEQQQEKPSGSTLSLDDFDTNMSEFVAPFEEAIKRANQERAQRRQAALAGGDMRIRGAAAPGKSSAFVNSVLAALTKTKPGPFALWGRVLVSFEISEFGQLKYVHLLKSSGNSALDQAAIEAIKKAQFEVPPAGLTSNERTFIIDYIFG